MSSASWALQCAIYAALVADDTLAALVGTRLYDAPPRKSEFPYVVFAEDEETAWNTADNTGSEHGITIQAWSRAGGRKECKAIADALRGCLDDADLTLDGHRLVSLRFRSAAYRREADGRTFRARLSFRAVTEPET